MRKEINKEKTRIYYFGEINELKDYLKFLSFRIPFHGEQIRKDANNLENICREDYLQNNIHTIFEKLYFTNKFILYVARNKFYIPFLLENCKYAEKYLILKNKKINPNYEIQVEEK